MKGYCGSLRWDIFDFLLQRPTGSRPLRSIQNYSNSSVTVEQDNLANCQKASENRRGRRPFLKTARKKVPLLTSSNPLNLVKHKACRTTHAKCSQEEQVQWTSSSRCCVSENLWGYGYFQTVHRPQEVSSHATIQGRALESFQAPPSKLPRLSGHFLDGHKGTASGRPALVVWRCWCQTGFASPRWPETRSSAGPHQSANLQFLPSWRAEGNRPDSDNRCQQAGPVQPRNSSFNSGFYSSIQQNCQQLSRLQKTTIEINVL